MICLAHLEIKDGTRREQTLKDHLRHVGAYTAELLESMKLYHVGYLAGILHDTGKFSRDFQNYLRAAVNGENVRRGSVIHSTTGVRYLFEKYHPDDSGITLASISCEIIAFAIGAHHGLFDAIDLNGDSGFEQKLKRYPADDNYKECIASFYKECMSEEELDTYFHKAMDEIMDYWQKINVQWKGKKDAITFSIGMLARVVLSALIDSDRRDVTEFVRGEKIQYGRGDAGIWHDQLLFMENKLSSSDFQSSTINEVRSQISDICRERAKSQGGIYKIAVPTGSGKTLSMLRYALAHAEHHKKDRILFVIPLLSVLEQNSQVIKKHLKDQTLLIEHHSNVIVTQDEPEELDMYELLTETWESPMIITTLVQLLNTLFDGKTSAIRRLHASKNSVIVIDEVQSVPTKLVYMFNMALNFLAAYMNTTIILCSATQPAFENLKMPLVYAEDADLVKSDEINMDVFKRTSLHTEKMTDNMSMDELAVFAQSLIKGMQSVLIICNKKNTASNLYQLLEQNKNYELFHLSTAMCMQHRKDTLEKIFDTLDRKNKKIICVATQLVEAGVDFSFECVVRVKAGIDNVVQSAGRCNRDGEYGRLCPVYIVSLKDEGLSHLRDIQLAQQCLMETKSAFNRASENYDDDFMSLKTIKKYYQLLYKCLEAGNTFAYPVKDGGITYKLFELLASNRSFVKYSKGQSMRQPFKTAGKLFHVFDTDTAEVIVPYNETAEEIIKQLTEIDSFDYDRLKMLIDQAKPYTIQLRGYQKEQFKDFILNETNFLRLQSTAYSMETGLKLNDDVTQWMM